jgi:hypothetical protein
MTYGEPGRGYPVWSLSEEDLRSPFGRRAAQGCDRARSAPAAVAASVGAVTPASHDQVLRYHRVGSTCRSSASGPALVTLIVISTSVGSAFAYCTSTIQ